MFSITIQTLGRGGEGSIGGILEGLEYIYDRFKAARDSTGKRPKMVVNMSLGSAGIVKSLDVAVKEMSQRGVIIVVAAGAIFSPLVKLLQKCNEWYVRPRCFTARLYWAGDNLTK